MLKKLASGVLVASLALALATAASGKADFDEFWGGNTRPERGPGDGRHIGLGVVLKDGEVKKVAKVAQYTLNCEADNVGRFGTIKDDLKVKNKKFSGKVEAAAGGCEFKYTIEGKFKNNFKKASGTSQITWKTPTGDRVDEFTWEAFSDQGGGGGGPR